MAGPTEFALETIYSGVTNGTERHALMSEHFLGAGRHGYQHVCRVTAVGEEVQDLAPEEVIFYGAYVGHRGWHVVDVRSSPLMVKLPYDLDHSLCALLRLAGVAMRAVRRLHVSVGQRVWVVGAGPIGVFGAQCARAVAARVTVSEIVDTRLQGARDTGAHCVIDMREPDAWDKVSEQVPFEIVLEAAGYRRLFFDIFEHGLLSHGGVMGAVAVRSETTFPWRMLHGTEGSIAVSCHFTVSDLQSLLRLIRQGVVQIGPIVSHRANVDEAPAIYATVRDDPRALYGVMFDWQQ